jgi:DNA-binding NtrC family response regulator
MPKNDASILIVDDEQSVRNSLKKWFISEGFAVETAQNADEAISVLRSRSIDLVLLDIKMPGMNGVEFNRWIHNLNSDIIVIMMTAYASVDTAVEALKDGAYDYVAKPIDPDDLTHIVRNALEKRRLAHENTQLKQQIVALSSPEDIIGKSSKLKHVLEMVEAVANTDATVMIRGESGTGKELVARAIHSNSSRRYAPIISVNCGAVAESLLESELFGHEKGAFTVFFDEIGNIGSKMQMELLRVLETKRFTRLGGEIPINVDFRVISATNRNLEEAVADGSFREDLYFRLNVFSIFIPPLRERTEDIDYLADYFVRRISQSMSRPVTKISEAGRKLILAYEWPGNVRELRNVIERAIVLCKGDTIEPVHLSFPFNQRAKQPSIGDTLEDAERAHVLRVLERCDWNISQAAKMLKIDRTTLYGKIKKYDLQQSR